MNASTRWRASDWTLLVASTGQFDHPRHPGMVTRRIVCCGKLVSNSCPARRARAAGRRRCETGVVSVVWVSVIVCLTAIVSPVPDEQGTAVPVRSQSEARTDGAASTKTPAKKAGPSGGFVFRAEERRRTSRAAQCRQSGLADWKDGQGQGQEESGRDRQEGREIEPRRRNSCPHPGRDEEPRSAFLQPPGSSPDDRYGEDSDWYELPAWRKTTFFGLRGRGQFFVYVVDCSGSMLDDDRLTRATIELRRSVLALAGAAEVRGDLLQQRVDSDAGRAQAADSRPPGQEPVALVAAADRARRRNRATARR